MAQLFSRAHVGVHFQTLFKTLKRIIKASTNTPLGGPKRFVPVFQHFTTDLYSFIHESAASDDRSFEDTLSWFVSGLSFSNNKTLDLNPLLSSLDDITYRALLNEVDQIVNFYDYRMQLKELQAEEELKEELENNDSSANEVEKPKTKKQDPNHTEKDDSKRNSKSKKDRKHKKDTSNNTTALADDQSEHSVPTPPPTDSKSSPTRTISEVPRPQLTVVPCLLDGFMTLIRAQFMVDQPTPDPPQPLRASD